MAEALLITATQAEEIFISAEQVAPTVLEHYGGVTADGVAFQFSASTLGLEPITTGEGDRIHVRGQTVPRRCAATSSVCGAVACALDRLPLSVPERQEKDCAAANTQAVFGDHEGYVLSPTLSDGSPTNEVVFMSDPYSSTPVRALDEQAREVTMFHKLAPGAVFVVGEHDIHNPTEGLVVELNGADSNWALATFTVNSTRYAAACFFSRTNLGSRPPDAHILRNAIQGVMDRQGISADEAQRLLVDFEVDVHIGYSATRRNFAHVVTVPPPESKYGQQLLQANGLIDLSGSPTGEVTPTMVMADQYPGALDNGEIYGQFEAENNIDAPRGPGGCPGHGERCHIDYRKITRRTVYMQLEAMGVPTENITYVDEFAVDPAERNNHLASNRLFQLAGVPASQTPRTANAVRIAFPPTP